MLMPINTSAFVPGVNLCKLQPLFMRILNIVSTRFKLLLKYKLE